MNPSELRSLTSLRAIIRQQREELDTLRHLFATATADNARSAQSAAEALANARLLAEETLLGLVARERQMAARDLAARDRAMRQRDAELRHLRAVLARVGRGGYLTEEDCQAALAEGARLAEEER